jgi:hypothetical protein
MQATFDKVVSFASSACQGIASTFQSKVEIRAETPIMGVPVWTLIVGVGAYVLWNNQRHAETNRLFEEMKQNHSRENTENMRLIQELREILSEIRRDEKDTILRENAALKERLNALEK